MQFFNQNKNIFEFQDEDFSQTPIADIIPPNKAKGAYLNLASCTITEGALQRLIHAGIKEINLFNCTIINKGWNYGRPQIKHRFEPNNNLMKTAFMDYPIITTNNHTFIFEKPEPKNLYDLLTDQCIDDLETGLFIFPESLNTQNTQKTSPHLRG